MQTRIHTLNDLRKGQQATIERYLPPFAAERRLMELGLLPGSLVRFVKVAPFGDPISIEIDGRHLCMRRREAAQIAVQTA